VRGGDAQGDQAVVGLGERDRLADGRLEGGRVADAVVAGEEAERGAAGAPVDGEAGERDGGALSRAVGSTIKLFVGSSGSCSRTSAR
jgi:hypothetical protein